MSTPKRRKSLVHLLEKGICQLQDILNSRQGTEWKAFSCQTQKDFRTCQTARGRRDLCNKQKQQALYIQQNIHLLSQKRTKETQ